MNINLRLLVLMACVICFQLAFGQTGTADGTYDFRSLGAANSASSGFKKVADKFAVNNQCAIVSSDNSLYDARANQDYGEEGNIVIKAEGGTVCKRFTLRDMALYSFVGSYNRKWAYTKFVITLTNENGGVIATHQIASEVEIGTNAIGHLRDIPFTTLWPANGYDNVARIDISFTGKTQKPEILGIYNMTVANVSGGAAAVAPTVTTAVAGSITNSSASLGGNITSDGGSSISGRGIVYSAINSTPTVGGSNTTTAPNGSTTGSFSATMNNLISGATYYYVAYAANSVGTSYGSVQQFTTLPVTATAQNVTVQLSANGTASLSASAVNNGSTGSGAITYTIQKIAYGRVSENNTLTLSTPNGANFTGIRFASFGTPTNDANGNYALGSCNAANSFATAQNSFLGRSTGSMAATNGNSVNNNPTLGDPCSGTPKALAVQAAYSTNAASLTYDCSEAGKTNYVLLTVTNGSSTSTAVASVTVNPPATATITNVSPNPAAPGATVTVTGTNLSAASSLTVNGASATISNLTATSFTFVVPSGAANSGNLVLVLPCSQTITTAMTVDRTTPVVATVAVPGTGTYTTGQNLDFVVNFDENVVVTGNPTLGLTIGSAGKSATLLSNSGNTITFRYVIESGDVDANGITIGNLNLGGGTIRDAAGNNAVLTLNNVSSTASVLVDGVRPTVVITSSAGSSGSTTSTTPIPFTVTFSESVAGFVQGDLTVTGGTVSGFSGSGTTYTFNVTPAAAGTTVTVNVAANTAQDAAGNGNTAATSFSIAYQTVDVNEITRLLPSPTATATVTYRLVFSTSVSGLRTSNFSLTSSGITGASVSSVSGSGTTYTVTVNTGTGDGTIRLNLANSTGLSPSISNVPYNSGDVYTITKSFAAAPTLRIQAAGSASNNGDVTAFVDLVQVLKGGTPVSNAVQNNSFETNNVPSANFKYGNGGVVSAPWNFNTSAGISRNNSAFLSNAFDGDAVALLQSTVGGHGSISQDLALPTGTYQVSFLASQRNYTSRDQVLNVFVNDVFMGSAQPTLYNSTTQNFTFASFSVDAPVLTATVSTASSSPTTTQPIPFSVNFSQSVGTTFTASDVTVTGGSVTASSFSGSGAGPYRFTVTPSGIGTVSVSLAANVANDANNTGNTASNTVSVMYSQAVTATPTLQSPINNSYSSNRNPIISGTASPNATITFYFNGSNVGTSTANGDGGFAVQMGVPQVDGSYTIYVTAQVAGQLVSEKSETVTFTIDNVRPSATISSLAGASGSSTSTSPIPFTVTFSESVTGFVQGDLLITNGTPSGFSGSGTTYTFNVTPTTPGTATTVNVAANLAQDAAGNGNNAATTFSITYQQVLPVTLVDYTAKVEGNAVKLAWRTAAEQRNSHFELWHSVDGQNFNFLDKVDGNGTSNQSHQYSFLHRKPQANTNYYRLVQVDLDGKSENLGVKSVNFKFTEHHQITVSPNPATAKVTVNFPIGTTNLEVVDMTGKIGMATRINPTASSTEINVQGLAAGTYIIRAKNPAGYAIIKLIKL